MATYLPRRRAFRNIKELMRLWAGTPPPPSPPLSDSDSDSDETDSDFDDITSDFDSTPSEFDDADSHCTDTASDFDDDTDSDFDDDDCDFIKHTDAMPKKANAFDYTNRASTGEKLGAIIAKDLSKELISVEKIAGRNALRKATFQMLDDTPPSYALDLKAPSKELGDEGVAHIATALVYVLKTSPSMMLEDLNLANNKLTTASLARLAPAIQLARYELKTFVISGNDIKITTDQQAAEFQSFLKAFAQCKVMRRIDFSGNVEFGARAFEVLCRVHTIEPQITPVALTVLLPEDDKAAQEATSPSASKVKNGNDVSLARMSNAGILARRCGLRSIPYIDLRNTGIDAAGALWLSFIIEDHYYPNQLITELNATCATTTIETYQQGAHDGGIDWRDNEASLTKDGTVVLWKSEAVRKQAIFGDDNDDMTGETDYAVTEHARKHSRSSAGGRRASLRTASTNDSGDQKINDLDSIRKRIQRNLIARKIELKVLNMEPGTFIELPKNELWSTGLIILSVSRKLTYIAPIKRKYYSGPDLHVREADLILPFSSHEREDSAFPKSKPKQGNTTYTSALSAQLAAAKVTDVTNRPAALEPKPISHAKATDKMRMQRTLPEYDDHTFPGDTLVARLGVMFTTATAEEYIVWQENYQPNFKYRDRKVACQLTMGLFEKIMGYATEETGFKVGVVSQEQKMNCWKWGQDKGTLVKGDELKGKDESVQMWMLLEGLECLSYGN
ncbi:hypothetical protein LTR95_014764 [Oleoguttula sp. CCFEE 5521]